MIDWHFNPDFRGREAEVLFGTLPATFAVTGERIAKAPLSTVERVAADGTRYYVKRYVGNGKNAVRRWFGLRGLVAPQRVVNEWENLLQYCPLNHVYLLHHANMTFRCGRGRPRQEFSE